MHLDSWCPPKDRDGDPMDDRGQSIELKQKPSEHGAVVSRRDEVLAIEQVEAPVLFFVLAQVVLS